MEGRNNYSVNPTFQYLSNLGWIVISITFKSLHQPSLLILTSFSYLLYGSGVFKSTSH